MGDDATALFASIGMDEDGRSALGVDLLADKLPDGLADSGGRMADVDIGLGLYEPACESSADAGSDFVQDKYHHAASPPEAGLRIWPMGVSTENE